MNPVLTARDLRVHYGPTPVLAGLDLDLHPGEVTVVLGENGAGKSTLLRALATELPLHGGQLHIRGVDAVRDPAAATHHLIHIAQHPPLSPVQTAREHLTALTTFRGLDPARVAADLGPTAAALRVDSVLDRPIRALSGGTAHKVALLLALVSHAPLVILDEPHAGLDVRSSLALRALIRDRRDAGTSFLLASHLAEATLALADRALVLRRGAPGEGARWALALDKAALDAFAGNARAFEDAVLAAMG